MSIFGAHHHPPTESVAHPQPSPPPPPRQPQMPTQPQCHPSPSQFHTSTQLPVPFPKPYIGAAQHNCNAKAQHVQTTPLELNDIHHSSGRVLKKSDYIVSIEGPHPAEEDSKEKSENHGLRLMKRRHLNQRSREIPRGYHQIFHVFKRKISKKRKMRKS